MEKGGFMHEFRSTQLLFTSRVQIETYFRLWHVLLSETTAILSFTI